MARNPLDVIAECLGEPADQMRNPVNAEYRCPFTNATCLKFNRNLGVAAPVCSIYRKGRMGARDLSRPPICVCPARFYEADIVEDVIRECWNGARPENPRIVHEIQMDKFGKVDLVIADITSTNTVRQFLPVELQAVDITGSYLPYYEALIRNGLVEKDKNYGINWANVRKRFISQMIAKGYHCHRWGTRIVAVIQEDLYTEFTQHARYAESTLEDSNVVFLLYQFTKSSELEQWTLKLKKVVPTTHTAMMNAVIYQQTPPREIFEKKIITQLTKITRER